jgi:hypothetical protein
MRKHPKTVHGIKVEHCSNFSFTAIKEFILNQHRMGMEHWRSPNIPQRLAKLEKRLSGLSRADLNHQYYQTLSLMYPY